MALIVEDGTGLATANAYVSLASALAYHADRGNAAWAASTDPLRTAAIIRATDAIDSTYIGRWPGFRSSRAQALEWPRNYAWDADGFPAVAVPVAVANATCEAALIELSSPGALSLKFERGLKTLGVGAISKSWDGSSGAGIMSYPTIRHALARIVKGGSTISLERT